MKNFSRNLNFILSAVLIILIWTQCTSKKEHKNPVTASNNATSTDNKNSNAPKTNIAYFNIDTLNSQIKFIVNKNAEFERKKKNMDAEIQRLSSSLEKKAALFQKKASEGGYTQDAAEAEQNRLMGEKNSIDKKANDYMNSLVAEQDAFHKKISEALNAALKEINAEAKYDYIFSHVEGGAMYECNPQLDITDQVAEILNSNLK